MDQAENREHWTRWAQDYGADLRATTKARTAKILELDALVRRIGAEFGDRGFTALEAGCGNGINCVHLAVRFAQATLDGVDFVAEMIAGAEQNAAANGVSDRTRFFVGDVTNLDALRELRPDYDLVFTDRCLINLQSAELQGRGIAALAEKVRPGGIMLMIENSLQTYGRQNDARIALGLDPRQPAEFNRFFTEEEMRGHIDAAGLDLADTEDFSSLHDLLLYAIVPATNGGVVDYDSPLVAAAAQLSLELSARQPSPFGAFGQNRLYVCRKPG